MPKEKRKKEKEKRKRISERRSDVGDLLAVLEVDALEMRTVLGQFEHPNRLPAASGRGGLDLRR